MCACRAWRWCAWPVAAAGFVEREVAVGPVRDHILAGCQLLHDSVDHHRDLVRLERDQIGENPDS